MQAISNIDYGGPLGTTIQHSTPYVIDTTPPEVEEVYNIQYNHTVNELSLEYNVTDEESGIRDVEIAIGRTPRDTGLLGWTKLELGGRGLVAVVIPDGVPGWVKLRATNNGIVALYLNRYRVQCLCFEVLRDVLFVIDYARLEFLLKICFCHIAWITLNCFLLQLV